MAQGYALGQPYSDGLSTQQVVLGSNPGANTNFTLLNDARWIWRPVSCVFTITTDANVANRYVTIEMADGGARSYAVSAAAVVVTASTTQRFCGTILRGTSEWNTGTDVLFPLSPVFLWPGDTFKITIGSIQAGDTITNIRFVFDRFPTGNTDEPGESE